MAIPWGVSKPGPIAEVLRFLEFPLEFPFGTPATPITCLGCGQEGPLRDGSYCTSACRKREWRRRRRTPLICAGCRRQFTPAMKGQRHCTRACRFKAYRRRVEAKAAAARASAIAKAAEAARARDIARKRSDFIASLIG
jgi:hypothetical protein